MRSMLSSPIQESPLLPWFSPFEDDFFDLLELRKFFKGRITDVVAVEQDRNPIRFLSLDWSIARRKQVAEQDYAASIGIVDKTLSKMKARVDDADSAPSGVSLDEDLVDADKPGLRVEDEEEEAVDEEEEAVDQEEIAGPVSLDNWDDDLDSDGFSESQEHLLPLPALDLGGTHARGQKRPAEEEDSDGSTCEQRAKRPNVRSASPLEMADLKL